MAIIDVNGASLHYEIQGFGPPLLLVMGASGDGGHFAPMARLLAEEFTVVSYDRRGNGRSPRPKGWTTTTPQEQAADAAALVRALGLGPVAVFGTSSGATFALCLLVDHPGVVRGCILHEPVIAPLYDDPSAAGAAAALAARTLEEGGGAALLMERFWRMVAGDEGWEALDPGLRARMRDTAATFAEVELGTFEDYLPDDSALARIAVPVRLLVSQDGRAPQQQAARRLARRLGTTVKQVPGSHAPYADHPRQTAAAVAALARQFPGAPV
ncbi:alpha/beta fold hydrolase [Nonomuraea sp. NPDC050663]|uniref:alpha/beta fold hydrolase n=1 Tax=Nonomuraea sp. NPDC050663 TaxID=3364370 RepID=UPI0037A39BE2